MNRTIFLIGLPALFLSTVSSAQNSVTLYGKIDEGFNFTSNGGGNRGYQMISGDVAGGRWGLVGNEDLGNDLSAVFKLENGFNLNRGSLGQGGLEFGRQAYVGLSSKQYGTFTMGRQYDPTIDMWSGFTGAGGAIGDLAAHPSDNDNSDYDYRIQNSVKYVSPTISGFSGEAMYAFSNAAGAFATNRMYSAAGSYTLGGLSAAVAYMKQTGGGANTTGAVSSATQVFSGSSQQNIDAGISYTFANKALLAFAYSHTDVYNPTSNAYFSTQPAVGSQKSWKFDNFDINGQWFFKADLWLAADYTYTLEHIATVEGRSVPKFQQVALMLNYDLSKRTAVYVQGAYQHVDGHSGTEFDNANIVGSSALSSTGNQMVYRVALLHQF